MNKPDISEQEVFDKVSVHLLTQNAQAMNMNGFCAYRGKGGLTCAVGCLIPDERYAPNLECNGVGVPIVYNALPFNSEPVRPLLAKLQRLHDSQGPSVWRINLKNIAHFFNLNTTAMDAVKETP